MVKSNEMICETMIDLNEHNILKKAYARKDAVTIKRLSKGFPSERFWLTLTHPQARDKNGNFTPQVNYNFILRDMWKYQLK